MSDVKPISFYQGSAPMPKGCVCDPFDYAALGHMTTCPCFLTREQMEQSKLPGAKIMNQSLYGKMKPYNV